MAHILLVDDDPEVLELTSELLALDNHTVACADSAEAALALLAANHNFDALVTDHSMPAITGETLVTRARALHPNLPCLLMTGYGDSVDITIDVRVLRKPFRASILHAAINDILADP